jgi:hypothetical protein
MRVQCQVQQESKIILSIGPMAVGQWPLVFVPGETACNYPNQGDPGLWNRPVSPERF